MTLRCQEATGLSDEIEKVPGMSQAGKKARKLDVALGLVHIFFFESDVTYVTYVTYIHSGS